MVLTSNNLIIGLFYLMSKPIDFYLPYYDKMDVVKMIIHGATTVKIASSIVYICKKIT